MRSSSFLFVRRRGGIVFPGRLDTKYDSLARIQAVLLAGTDIVAIVLHDTPPRNLGCSTGHPCSVQLQAASDVSNLHSDEMEVRNFNHKMV